MSRLRSACLIVLVALAVSACGGTDPVTFAVVAGPTDGATGAIVEYSLPTGMGIDYVSPQDDFDRPTEVDGAASFSLRVTTPADFGGVGCSIGAGRVGTQISSDTSVVCRLSLDSPTSGESDSDALQGDGSGSNTRAGFSDGVVETDDLLRLRVPERFSVVRADDNLAGFRFNNVLYATSADSELWIDTVRTGGPFTLDAYVAAATGFETTDARFGELDGSLLISSDGAIATFVTAHPDQLILIRTDAPGEDAQRSILTEIAETMTLL